MNSYYILKDVHRVGHPIWGVVSELGEIDYRFGYPTGRIKVDVESDFQGWLGYENLADLPEQFDEALIPKVGDKIKMVVLNQNGKNLYLSAKPQDLKKERINQYQEFYKYVDSLEIGKKVIGKVDEVAGFGIFVNIGIPFLGLIDIGHGQFNGGEPLPRDYSLWPQKNDEINCVISYFRFAEMKVGLGWVPEMEV